MDTIVLQKDNLNVANSVTVAATSSVVVRLYNQAMLNTRVACAPLDAAAVAQRVAVRNTPARLRSRHSMFTNDECLVVFLCNIYRLI